MAMLEEMEQTGNRLFRWRSFLPLILVGIFLLALQQYRYPDNSRLLDEYWEIICLGISFFGLGIRALTIGFTPERTSGRNTREQIADTLNTSGVYSLVRHPLYLGNFFMGLGIALFIHTWWMTLIYILLFWVYYERIMIAEEGFLRKKFGSVYLDWAAVTPAFVPRFGAYRKAELPFSFRNVLRREYNGFFAIVVTLFMLETVGDFVTEGTFSPDTWWLVLLTISFVIWLVLRTLKKYTRLLAVEGR
ncbi:MAG TPA: isoprenylcysteine carboxylmethyltransferase family protein [Gammaproteobacteria bacterium]|nr:isoprenylcysteine carboxylmethyltransferase family protein [Gammaproteobacteria bacterium]